MSSLTAVGKPRKSRLADPTQCSGVSPAAGTRRTIGLSQFRDIQASQGRRDDRYRQRAVSCVQHPLLSSRETAPRRRDHYEFGGSVEAIDDDHDEQLDMRFLAPWLRRFSGVENKIKGERRFPSGVPPSRCAFLSESIRLFSDGMNDSIRACRCWSATSPDATGGVLRRPCRSRCQRRNTAVTTTGA